MFVKEIKYVDFSGVERKENFQFHLSLPEVTRIEAKIGKGLAEHTKELVERRDLNALITFLEEIILTSYGRKSADGRFFQKNKELREEFEYSQAYAEFFEMLLTDNTLAKEFGEKVADNGKVRKNAVAPKVVE